MTEKINELTIKVSDLNKRNDEIISQIEEIDKREEKTEDDLSKREGLGKEFDTNLAKIDVYKKDISRLEANERNKKEFGYGNIVNKDDGESKEIKREYNIGKAVYEFARGNQISGFEGEIHSDERFRAGDNLVIPEQILVGNPFPESERAYTTSSAAETITTNIGKLSIRHYTGFEDLKKLGVRFETKPMGYGEYKPLYANQVTTTSKVSETTAASELSLTMNPNKLKPERFSAWSEFTEEEMASMTPQSFQTLIQYQVTKNDIDQVKWFWNSVYQDSSTSFDASTAIGYKSVLDLRDILGSVMNGGFATTKALRSALEAGVTSSTASGSHIWTNGRMGGEIANAFDGLDTGYLMFADWSESILTRWGGLQIIRNPYSKDKEGTIRITTRSLADAAFLNPNAIKGYTGVTTIV